jgi:hypothetical protein
MPVVISVLRALRSSSVVAISSEVWARLACARLLAAASICVMARICFCDRSSLALLSLVIV